jgi:hypothetical protein
MLFYLHVVIIKMKWDTLIQHLELEVICEESLSDMDNNQVLLYVYPMMNGNNKKTI